MAIDIKFAELIATKICHDFSGSIGAVHNGVEFIEDEGQVDIHDQMFLLVSDNAKHLVSKLRFYRQMFGATSLEGRADLGGIKTTVEDILESTKIKLHWNNKGIAIKHSWGRLLLIMVYISMERLAYGGELEVFLHDHTGTVSLDIVATSSKLIVSEELINILHGSSNIDMKVENIATHFAYQIASDIGVVIRAKISPTEFSCKIEFN